MDVLPAGGMIWKNLLSEKPGLCAGQEQALHNKTQVLDDLELVVEVPFPPLLLSALH